MEEFNACLKRSRFCKKIKDFTLVSDACHQNIEGKSWCLWPRFDFLTNQRLFFLEVKLYRSSSFNKTVLWYLLWQDQVVLGEISRPHGERLLTSFKSLQYMPVIKATSTRTSKKNIQWWKILPSSDKEIINALQKFIKFRPQPQKTNSISKKNSVSFTNRRWPTAVRQTIMYAAWPDNISLQFTSLPPKGFQKVLLVSITIFISSYLHFFSNTSFSKISVTLNQDDLQSIITWQKKEPALFWSANFPRLALQFT